MLDSSGVTLGSFFRAYKLWMELGSFFLSCVFLRLRLQGGMLVADGHGFRFRSATARQRLKIWVRFFGPTERGRFWFLDARYEALDSSGGSGGFVFSIFFLPRPGGRWVGRGHRWDWVRFFVWMFSAESQGKEAAVCGLVVVVHFRHGVGVAI